MNEFAKVSAYNVIEVTYNHNGAACTMTAIDSNYPNVYDRYIKLSGIAHFGRVEMKVIKRDVKVVKNNDDVYHFLKCHCPHIMVDNKDNMLNYGDDGNFDYPFDIMIVHFIELDNGKIIFITPDSYRDLIAKMERKGMILQ